jgi:hypothetical protein
LGGTKISLRPGKPVRRINKSSGFRIARCDVLCAYGTFRVGSDYRRRSTWVRSAEVLLLVPCLFGLKWAFEAAAKARRIWLSPLPNANTEDSESI